MHGAVVYNFSWGAAGENSSVTRARVLIDYTQSDDTFANFDSSVVNATYCSLLIDSGDVSHSEAPY